MIKSLSGKIHLRKWVKDFFKRRKSKFFLNRINEKNKKDIPACDQCGVDETAEHFVSVLNKL